jgi:TetR/AcrR family transcriptional regulator, transcriptional repressor for nem operon
MARPKEFDRDTALQKAVDVFCDHGYDGTSTEELIRAMDISRQSLYDTFGDKRQLYLQALQQYVFDSVGEQIRALNSSPSSLKGVEAALQAFVVNASSAEAPGCLGIGATCEFGVSDREVTTLISAADKALQSSLERRINEGKDAGEIGADIDARAAAQFIKATFAGIKVAARGGAPADTLRNIARMAVRSLK